MATLKEVHKVFLIARFAGYDTPQQAADALREEFDVEIPRAQAVKYNPESDQFGAAKKYISIFEELRERFVSDTSEIAVAQKSYRLRELEHLYAVDKKRGNTMAAAKHLEQAAKEMGEVYSNTSKLQHTGARGGPIRTVKEVNTMTREEVLAELAQMREKQIGYELDINKIVAESADKEVVNQ